MRALRKIIFLGVLGITACAGSQNEGLVRPGPVLVVENEVDEPVDCFSDGWYLGTVKIGGRDSFGNMRARKQKITAHGLRTGKDYWTIVDLARRSRVVWKVRNLKKSGPKTSPYIISVKNQQGTKVDVVIDGHAKDSVAGLGTGRFEVEAPGRHKVVVKDPTSKINRYFTVYVQKGVLPVLDIKASNAVIRVKNRENKGVFVALDQGASRLVAAGKSVAFKRVKPGKHRVRFITVSGQACGDFEVHAAPGREVNIAPQCPKAELMIINETKDEVEIRLGGGILATCPAEGAVAVGNIPTGTLHLKAWAGDQLVSKAVRTAHSGQKVLWMISQGAGIVGDETLGTLVVYNQSGRNLELWIDKINRGIVRNGRNLLLTSMSAGDHRVDAYCTATGTDRTAIMHYEGNERLKWTIGPVLGSARIKNLWNEPVTMLIDGVHTYRLKIGETMELPLPAGWHIFEINGRSLDLADKINADIDPGQWTLVELRKPLGTVVIHNTGTRPLKVFLDDEKIGTLQPDTEVKVDSVHSGTHKVVAHGTDSMAKWLDTINVVKGRTTTVKIGQ